jgi:hypothetical protein
MGLNVGAKKIAGAGGLLRRDVNLELSASKGEEATKPFEMPLSRGRKSDTPEMGR